jgi:integrase
MNQEQFRHGEISESIHTLISCKATRTQEAYHCALDSLASFLQVKKDSYAFEQALLSFSPANAARFLSWFRRKKVGDGTVVADSTVSQRLAILRRVFRHLIDIGARMGNPIATLKDFIPTRQRVQKRPTKLIPFDLVQRLLDAPSENTKKGIRDRAILAVLFGGGLRRSEALKLNVGDIGESSDGVPFLILRSTKAGQNQEQSLPSWAWQRLLSYLEQRDSEGDGSESPLFVFYYEDGRQGGRLSESTLARLYKRYAEESGCGSAAPHSARATAVTMLKELGFEDREVARFLRHSTEQMVRAYDKRGRGPAANPGRQLEYRAKRERRLLAPAELAS